MTASYTRRALFSLAGVAGVGLAVAACSSDGGKTSATQQPGAAGSGSTAGPSAAKPAASKLEPAQVPLAGGVTVTVHGTGLDVVKGVTVAGIAARDVEATATKVTFTGPAPGDVPAGDADVALFTEAIEPSPSANQSSDGNGSSANDGQSRCDAGHRDPRPRQPPQLRPPTRPLRSRRPRWRTRH